MVQGIGHNPKLPGGGEARAEFWRLKKKKKIQRQERGKDGRCDSGMMSPGGGGQMQFQKAEHRWATAWSCEIL